MLDSLSQMESLVGGDVWKIEVANTWRVVEVKNNVEVSIGATVESNVASNATVEKEQDLQQGMSHPD